MASLASGGILVRLGRVHQNAGDTQCRRAQTYVSTHYLLRYRLIQQEAFIRALACLSRYGDDLVLYADTQHFTMSATNSSLSAYCRFRYGRMFFSRYRVGDGVNGADPSTPSEPLDVKGQLLVKVRSAYAKVSIYIDLMLVDTVVDIQAQNY